MIRCFRRHRTTGRQFLVFWLCVSAAAAARAQTETAAPAAAVISTNDSLLALVPARSVDDIKRDMGVYTAQRDIAENEARDSQMLQQRAKIEIQLKKSQIETIKVNADVAKKEKNDIAKGEWESKKRLAELEKTLLERREAVRAKEIEYANAKRANADANIDCLNTELALAGKRAERASIQARALTPEVVAALRRADEDLDGLQKRTLDAQVKAAEARKNVASKEVDLAKNRKQVLEAQIKLMRGN